MGIRLFHRNVVTPPSECLLQHCDDVWVTHRISGGHINRMRQLAGTENYPSKGLSVVRCEVRLARLFRQVQRKVDTFRFPGRNRFQRMHNDPVLIYPEPSFVDFSRQCQILFRHTADDNIPGCCQP
jgi:hypothetical protein